MENPKFYIVKNIPIRELVLKLGMIPNSSNKILSIYKEEKHPSLHIYEETNSYVCFSTGNRGDIIDFYMDFRSIDFPSAINELYQMFYYTDRKPSIKLIHSSVKPNERIKLLPDEKEIFEERAGKYEYDANLERVDAERMAYQVLTQDRFETATIVYNSLYENSSLSEEAHNYLTSKTRNLTDPTINAFRLFSLNSDAKHYLIDTFSPNQLIISGLFNQSGKFIFENHRLIIPYIENGRIVYLRGRFLEGIKSHSYKFNYPKYLSPYNSLEFLSSKRFFNLDTLKNPSIQLLYITEGEFDCMISEQNGINAIGIPGVSSFPESQIKLLDSYEIVLAFDSDAAGQQAIQRIAPLFKRKVWRLVIKDGKDLTEVL